MGTITTVRFEQLKNLGNYENIKVCLEAIVQPDESAKEVYEQLKAEAQAMLNPPDTQGTRW